MGGGRPEPRNRLLDARTRARPIPAARFMTKPQLATLLHRQTGAATAAADAGRDLDRGRTGHARVAWRTARGRRAGLGDVVGIGATLAITLTWKISFHAAVAAGALGIL